MEKQVVYYIGTPVLITDQVFGIMPVNHPFESLNGIVVRTSVVLNFNEATGFIETRNTIYMPFQEIE